MFLQDEQEITSGGGCGALFGLPFLIAGCVTFYLVVFGKVEGPDADAMKIILPFFSFIFGGIGVAFVFGRSGTILNRREKTVCRWWGLLVPFSKKTYRLDRQSWVHINKEVRRSKNNTYNVYPVRIHTQSEKLKIEEVREFPAARKLAERIAKFMELGIRDESAVTVLERPAGTLDESLRERYAREGVRLEMPRRPQQCRIKEWVEGDVAWFELPERGWMALLPAGLTFIFVVPFLFFVFTMFVFNDESGLPWYVIGLIMSIPFIIGGLMTMAGLRSIPRQERIGVSKAGVQVVQKLGLGSATIDMSSDEIEELMVDPKFDRPQFLCRGRLTIHSDKGTCIFGAGLNKQESEWLRSIVEYLITAPK